MRAGALKTIIKIYSKDDDTKNAMHESVTHWSLFRTVHAQKKLLSSAETWQAQVLTSSVSVQFVIRYDSDTTITSDMVILDDRGEWYDILAPIQQDYARRSLLITGKLRIKPPEGLSDGV